MIRSPDRQPDESTLEGLAQRGAIVVVQKLEKKLEEVVRGKKKKAEKKAAKKAKKAEEPSEKPTPGEYEKLISSLEEQIVSNVELLGGLKDATEFVSEGGDFVESILTLLGREVDLATEQGDLPAVDMHNQRRSAVARLTATIQHLKDVEVLKQVTGTEIARLFDLAITGNLTLAEADAEIAKFSPESKPAETIVEAGSPESEASKPAERSEPAKPEKLVEAAKPPKPEGPKPSVEEVTIDLSNPVNIPDFMRQLRAMKNKTIEVPFSDGKLGVVKVSSLADVAQRHIQNLAGIAKNPERQAREARAIIKAAPKDFGYQAGLRKLFIDLKFIEDPQVKIAEKVRKDEVFRGAVMAATSFATLYNVLADHPEHIKERDQSFPMSEIISVLSEVERAAERKDGLPVPKSLMAMLPVECGVQAKAAEFFIMINPFKSAEEQAEGARKAEVKPAEVTLVDTVPTRPKQRKSDVAYSAKPARSGKKVISVSPGMSGVEITSQQAGGALRKNRTGFAGRMPVGAGGLPEEKRGIEITDELVARTEAVAIEQAAGVAIEAILPQIDQVILYIGKFRRKFKDSQNQEFKNILEEVETFEVEGTRDESTSKRLLAYKVMLNRYQEMLVKIQALEPLLQSELEQNSKSPVTRAVKPIAFAPRKESVTPEQVTLKKLQETTDELSRVEQVLNALWFKVDESKNTELIKKITEIFPAVVAMNEEMKPFADKSASEKLAAYTALLEKYQDVLAKVRVIWNQIHIGRSASTGSSRDAIKDQPKSLVPGGKVERKIAPISVQPNAPVQAPVVGATVETLITDAPKVKPQPKKAVTTSNDPKKTTHRLSPELVAAIKAPEEEKSKAIAEAKRAVDEERKKTGKIPQTTPATPVVEQGSLVPPPVRSENLDKLNEEFRKLQEEFDKLAEDVSTILTDNPQDAEIQAKKPIEDKAKILRMLASVALLKRIRILKDTNPIYEKALHEMQAILVQRQQAQQNQPVVPGVTPGLNPGQIPGQPQGIPQPPAQPGQSQNPLPPIPPGARRQTPSPVPTAPNWLKKNWVKWTGIAALAGLMGYGGAEINNALRERDARRTRAESAATSPDQASGRRTAPETNTQRPVASVDTPPRSPEASARTENYPGINFNSVLLKYPEAINSSWVFTLFSTVDQDVQMIRSPEDVDDFFKKYFGELNVGNYDYIKGRDPEPSQLQENEYNRVVSNGTKFDVKIKYKLLTPEDLKLRLALVTTLREVLMVSHLKFEKVPGADKYIGYAQRLNNCAAFRKTLEGGLQKLDPLFDSNTITNDGAILDRLLEAQRARR